MTAASMTRSHHTNERFLSGAAFRASKGQFCCGCRCWVLIDAGTDFTSTEVTMTTYILQLCRDNHDPQAENYVQTRQAANSVTAA